MNKERKPTNAELEILDVLWRQGPSTVREVYETLSKGRNPGYTTVLKLLQIMTEKGLVVREESGRAHIYQPRHSKEEAQRTLLDDLMERAFGGSAQSLVMHALSTKRASAEELAEIRKLIERLEEEQQ